MIIKIANQEFDPTQIAATEWSYAEMELWIAVKDGDKTRIVKIPEIEIAMMGYNRWQDFIRQVEATIPTSITFFSNGTACVGNKFNQQMGQYQIGGHQDTIDALKQDGFNWWDLNVAGSPQSRESYVANRVSYASNSGDLPNDGTLPGG